MKKNIAFTVIFLMIFMLSSCTGGSFVKNEEIFSENNTLNYNSDEAEAFSEESEAYKENDINTDNVVIESEMFSARDMNTAFDGARVSISLNGNSAVSSSDSVRINGGIITLTEEAVYEISGKLNDGMIYVDAGDAAKISIILNGAEIICSDNAPLYVLSCDKVFVTLKDNTENTLENGGAFTVTDGNNIDGAVFSKSDLTFNGNGALAVISPSAHGIVCKDDLVFTGGNIKISSASHGIDANDSVRVKGTSFEIDSGKDGVHCENEDDAEKGFIYIESGVFNVSAEGDGLSAGASLSVKDGTFDILSGGGSENAQQQAYSFRGGVMGSKGDMNPNGGKGGPMGPGGMRPDGNLQPEADASSEDSESLKGLKAEGCIDISGGTFTFDTADDSIHSNSDIIISEGTFNISSGDDGVHADENLTISGGAFDITESYEGLEALHIKISEGDITLTASDDGLNAAGGTDGSGAGGFYGGDMFGGGMSAGNGSIVISGGKVYITASGDGIDANGTLEITGGYTVVTGPTQGDTATLDYDRSAVISGGTFIGTGASGMAQTFSDSTQGVIAVTVGMQPAGTDILLKDSDENTLIEFSPSLSFGVVILSSPDIVKNAEYNLFVGDMSSTFNAR